MGLGNWIQKLTFESGHGDLWNGFRAEIMPYTDDHSLITCGGDGQVRHAQISECGVETMLLAKHQCNASDLAFEPGSPHLIYTCGEDGLVQHIDLRTAAATALLRCQPIRGCKVQNLIIHLYAIAIDPSNPNVFAVDMGPGNNPIASSPSSSCSEAIGKATPQVYKGHGKKEGVDNLSFFGPKSKYVVSGSGNGRVYIWKKKGGELVRAKKEHVVGSIVSSLIHIPHLRDWETGIPKLTFESVHEHLRCAFCAKIMPYSDDHSLITCAGDGEIDLRTAVATKLHRCQPIDGCRVRNLVISLCVIAIDPRNPNVLAVVGSDQYTRLYDICKYKCDGSTDFERIRLISSPSSSSSEANGKSTPQVYKGHGKKGVDSLSFFGLKSEYVVSGSGNGRLYIWKKRGGGLVHAKKEHVLGVDCTESHSHTTALASSGADGIEIWTPNDIDKTKLLATKTEQDQHVYLVLVCANSTDI
ncbi:hypothetical protein GQ457_14G025020 [Hibiscus cannabinus]